MNRARNRRCIKSWVVCVVECRWSGKGCRCGSQMRFVLVSEGKEPVMRKAGWGFNGLRLLSGKPQPRHATSE